MKINTTIVTRLFFLIFLAVIVTPTVRYRLNPGNEKELKGAIETNSKPSFSVKGWMDESYQQGFEAYSNQHFGFRNSMVRLHNQISFSLFRKTNARDVIIGKEDYLYERNYIRAFYGEDFKGDSIISERVARLKTLSHSLLSKGKLLMVVFSPGKGQFYPEYIPDYLKSAPGRTNYQAWKEIADTKGLTIIDFNDWFLQMKGKSEFPIYPKTGIHWSQYGVDLVIDSLLNYIEIRQGVDMPDYIITERFLSTEYEHPDTDLEDGMNLIFPIPNVPMAYSRYTFNKEGKLRPKIMVISDSFFWPIFSKGINEMIFDNGEFWYYNQEIYTPDRDAGRPAAAVDINQKLNEIDIVMLMVTDANLPGFPWGFDQQAVAAISPDAERVQAEREARIRGYIDAIMNSPEWKKSIQDKAIQNNITFEEQVRLDAIYMLENEVK